MVNSFLQTVGGLADKSLLLATERSSPLSEHIYRKKVDKILFLRLIINSIPHKNNLRTEFTDAYACPT
jgi:hypothetical protein